MSVAYISRIRFQAAVEVGITWKKPLVADAPSGEDMVMIKELKDPSHAPNLLLQIWVIIC